MIAGGNHTIIHYEVESKNLRRIDRPEDPSASFHSAQDDTGFDSWVVRLTGFLRYGMAFLSFG